MKTLKLLIAFFKQLIIIGAAYSLILMRVIARSMESAYSSSRKTPMDDSFVFNLFLKKSHIHSQSIYIMSRCCIMLRNDAPEAPFSYRYIPITPRLTAWM